MNEAQAQIRVKELCQASVNLFAQIEAEKFNLSEDIEFMLKRWDKLCSSILINEGAISEYDPKIAVKRLFMDTLKSLKLADEIIVRKHPNQINVNTTMLTGIIVNIDVFVNELEGKKP